MNRRENDNLVVLLLLLSFLAIISIKLTSPAIEISDLRLVLILGSLVLIVTVYIYLQRKYEKRLNRIVYKLNQYHYDIAKDSKINLTSIVDDTDLAPFYDSLEKIDSWLTVRDDSYGEILELLNSVALNIELDKLLESIMPKLLEVTDSSCGAFYIVEKANNMLTIKHSLGFSKNVYEQFDIGLGEGFFGLSLNDNEIKLITDIPDDTIYYIRSFLGKIKPKNIMIAPISDSESTVGVLLLASIFDYNLSHNSMIGMIRSYLGIAVSNSLTYERTKRLSNELKFQNRLIQDLNNDLEKKIKDRTLFLNSIIDSIEDYVIYAIDKDFKITAWNNGATNTLGYLREEVLGRSIFTIFSEGELAFKKDDETFEWLTKHKKIKEQGWRLKKDGTKYFADINIFKMFDNLGDTLGYSIVIRDITALRKTEDDLWIERGLFRKILDSSSRALLVTNADGQIELFNDNASTIFNRTDLFGLNLSEFFQEEEELLKNINYLSDNNTSAELAFNLKSEEKSLTLRISSLMDKAEIRGKLFFHILVNESDAKKKTL